MYIFVFPTRCSHEHCVWYKSVAMILPISRAFFNRVIDLLPGVKIAHQLILPQLDAVVNAAGKSSALDISEMTS